MKRILLGWVVVLLAVSPALCEEHELDVGREMEHLELEREQAEFRFEQEIRELELGERRMQLEHRARNATRPAHKPGRFAHVMWLVCMITHVLMALWVYQDVRKKDNGNGIWIVITLLVGFFGSAVYALIRLGDCPPKVE